MAAFAPRQDEGQYAVLAQLLTPILGKRAGYRARSLIDEMGSIAGVIGASPEELRRVMGEDGDLATLLTATRKLIDTGLREQIERAPVDTEAPAFLDYLIMRFCGRRDEQLLGLFIDRRGGFIAERVVAFGSGDSLHIHPRTLFTQAMGVDCAAIVLVHNHPSGDPTPSLADISATKLIVEHATVLDIQIVDHLIVAGNRVFSMKKAGLL